MSLVFEKYNSVNLFIAGKNITSARVKMQGIVYLWDFSSQQGNVTQLMVYFPSFFSIIKMPISEDHIFTKTKAMASLDHEVTLLAACCSVKPGTSPIICYYEVFSKDGAVEEKMKVVQVQLAHQWSALPKCRSPEPGERGHWRDRCRITVRFAKLSKWLDTGKYWQLSFSGCGQRTGFSRWCFSELSG